MKKFSYILLLLFVTFACVSKSKITVTNIQDLAAYTENSIVYSIPRSRIALTTIAVRHFTIPGPYRNYAEKYLGIKNTPSISKTEWELNNVVLDVIQQADPDYYFSVQTSNPKTTFDEFLELTEGGMALKLDDHNSFFQFKKSFEDIPEPIHFTDLSVKKNLLESKSKVNFSQVDVPVDLPFSKQKKGIKTINQKAEEAANFIIKIRKRRFKLLSGQYDVFPEGIALETSINELNKLEKEYLYLFIGKTYSDTITKTFFFIPQTNQELERYVFCRFSDETGFHDALGTVGKPLVMELRNMHFTEVLHNLQFPLSGPTYENILFYRIPDMASVKIFYSSKTIIEAEIKICQYGALVPWSISK